MIHVVRIILGSCAVLLVLVLGRIFLEVFGGTFWDLVAGAFWVTLGGTFLWAVGGIVLAWLSKNPEAW